jgi:hypothetical protein
MKIYINALFLLSCAFITTNVKSMDNNIPDDLAAALSSLSTASSFAPLTGRPTALAVGDADGDAEISEIVIEKTPLQRLIESCKFTDANKLIGQMSAAQIAGEYISSLYQTTKNIKFRGTTAEKEQQKTLLQKLKSLNDSPTSGSDDEYKSSARDSKKDLSPKSKKDLSPKH